MALIFIFSKKKQSATISNKQSVKEQKFEKMKKTIKTDEVIIVEEPKETDEEREKRRREKEDPSRFMPQ
jgi:hypothetical protein